MKKTATRFAFAAALAARTDGDASAEFPSLDDAKAWADADPYIAARVYEHVSVKPFKQVFPPA